MVRYKIQDSFAFQKEGFPSIKPHAGDIVWAEDDVRHGSGSQYIALRHAQYPTPTFFGRNPSKFKHICVEQTSGRTRRRIVLIHLNLCGLSVLFGRHSHGTQRKVSQPRRFVSGTILAETFECISQPSAHDRLCAPLSPDLKSIGHLLFLSTSACYTVTCQTTWQPEIPDAQKPEGLLPLKIFKFTESLLHTELSLTARLIRSLWLVLSCLSLVNSVHRTSLRRNIYKSTVIFLHLH